MLRRRLQILADGEEIHLGRAQIVHHLRHLRPLLPQAHHQAGLGEHRGIEALHLIEEAQRLEIARPRPHLAVEPRHGLEVMIEDVGLRRHHYLDGALLVQEVGRQHLDGGIGRAPADRLDHAHELHRAAVVEIVAVDRGHHDMGEAELRRRFRHVLGLVRDRADPAVPSPRCRRRRRGCRRCRGSSRSRASASSTRRCWGRPPPRRRY